MKPKVIACFFEMFNCILLGSVVLWGLMAIIGDIGCDAVYAQEYFLGDRGNPANYDSTIKPVVAEYQLPEYMNWADDGIVPPAKNQGSCGSCWAFVCAAVLESKIAILDGVLVDVSEEQQIACNTEMGGCRGGDSQALEYWYSNGPMEESCAEYTESDSNCSGLSYCNELSYNTFDRYTAEIPDGMKPCLFDGPAYFRFDVYEDFMTFWKEGLPGRVYTQSTGAKAGGHAVLMIGWDDRKGAWLCQNSWGKTAGPNRDGTFWIAYAGHANDLSFGMANVRISGESGTWPPDDPVADAGADQTVQGGNTVVLDGSGSFDPEDTIIEYIWAQLTGTPVTLSNENAVSPTFIAPDEDGTSLTFQLTVVNDAGLASTDTCVVNVGSVSPTGGGGGGGGG